MAQCKALTTPDTQWDFCPSIGASYLFLVLFGLTTLAHLAQAIFYRKFYCWVITVSGLIQTLTYVFRVLSILSPASYTDYAAWFILILIAPLWTNAFVYMVMGRMVWNFTDDAQVLRVKPWRFGLFFVILDIIAFIVQVYGAAQAAGNHITYEKQMEGLHIYMGGVGVQQLFVLLFVACAISFHRKVIRQRRSDGKQGLLLLYVLYACLALITMRIIFRLCEYSQGLKSKIPRHEAYQYCLDSVPMLISLVALNVVHPGRIMPVRRVKCGEERPFCTRCTSTGRKCDGYQERTTPSLTSRSSTATPRTIVQALSGLPSNIFTSDQERRSFQFFLAKTAPQLAGDFECAFWERLLLQSVYHEPAIRHVTVALGSLHEHFGTSGTLGTDSVFAMNQYVRAMGCLRSVSGAVQPLDVCLISSVLFTCFEAMRGHYGSAITHILGGLKILSELRVNSSSTSSLSVGRTPYVPLAILSGVFARLQAQAMVSVQQSTAATSNLWPELAINLEQPSVFNSLAEAREMLELYTYHYRQRSIELQNQLSPTESLHIPLSSPLPSDLVTANPSAIMLRNRTLSLLARWSTALDIFLSERGDSLTNRERRGTAVLQLRKIDSFITLDILQFQQDGGIEKAADQLRWDSYCPHFEQMVARGEVILQSSGEVPTSPLSTPKPTPKTFSLDLGIIGSMFFVATRCRDPYIRRRAVAVLRAAGVQEGVWNSVVVASIAERWIAIEEEGLTFVHSCADIPAAVRLAHFRPVFDLDQPSALVYFAYGDGDGMDAGRVRRLWLGEQHIYWL
ncbi:hypothetical protein N8T08_003361 [Aspergillus melleus]|uniref:Uncharacterized protein n=1 Tax=Aspergillus melleus TaxID=138277 RepID=A0ACC3BG43_9EURO|nr:hypothetical protein N8T08_003361 [Aspergillus melleus]